MASLNVLVGALSLATLLFLLVSSRVPAEIRPGPGAALSSGALAIVLVSASIAALMGRPRARLVMLGAALAFFGAIAVQNLLLLSDPSVSGDPKAAQKLISTSVRSVIELALNAWALLSAKTVAFFAARQRGL